MNSEHKHKKQNRIIAIIILIFAIIVAAIILFYQQSKELLSRKKQTLEDLKTTLRFVEHQQKGLKDKKEELDLRFKRNYFMARLIVILLWAIVQVCLIGYFGFVDGITNSLVVNGYIISMLVLCNFLLFGKVTELEQFVKRFEMFLRNRSYRHYLNIDNDILAYDDKKKEIITQIEALEKEIEEIEKEN